MEFLNQAFPIFMNQSSGGADCLPYGVAHFMFHWQQLGWSEKGIKRVMKMKTSFGIMSLIAAEENYRWDTRQQMVVSKYVDDDDDFLDSVRTASWIKMVPLNDDIPTVTAVPGQRAATALFDDGIQPS